MSGKYVWHHVPLMSSPCYHVEGHSPTVSFGISTNHSRIDAWNVTNLHWHSDGLFMLFPRNLHLISFPTAMN